MEYKGKSGLVHANKVLNGHLTKMADLKTRACEVLSASQVHAIAKILYGDADTTLLDVYTEAKDDRQRIFSSEEEMDSDFAELLSLTRDRSELHDVLRDGLCHRVVMWFVHHLPKAKQVELAQLGIELPLLPVEDHSSLWCVQMMRQLLRYTRAMPSQSLVRDVTSEELIASTYPAQAVLLRYLRSPRLSAHAGATPHTRRTSASHAVLVMELPASIGVT